MLENFRKKLYFFMRSVSKKGLADPLTVRWICMPIFFLLPELCYWAWSELVDDVHDIGYDFSPFCTFRCGNERHPEPAVIEPDAFHQPLDHEHPLCSLEVTFKIVAVTEMTSGDKYSVRTICKCFQDEERIDPARAHDTDNPYIGRVLDTTATCQVGSCIGTPVADNALDLGLPLSRFAFWHRVFGWCRHYCPPPRRNASI